MELPAAKFRVRFFELLDEIGQTNEEIVITKHGRPVARVVPFRARRPGRRNGCLAGTVEVLGDLESPCLEALDGELAHFPPGE
jgi:prevent-host-death family protein